MIGLFGGLLASSADPAKGWAVEKVIEGALGLLQKRGFRTKILAELPSQLTRLGFGSNQTRYILNQLSQPEALKNIGAMTTPEDFQAEMIRWLEHPQQYEVGDPRQTEAELVTAALMLAVLKVSNPGQHQALLTELLVSSHIQERSPTIGQAVRSTEERRKAPVQMALNDISQVLVRSGQKEARVITGADGKHELSGLLRLNLTAGGENGRRLQKWLQQPQTNRLVLDVSKGSFKLSLGNDELDRIFFPGEASELAFEVAPIEIRAKLKIAGKARTKFADGVFLILHHNNEARLTIGNKRCKLELTFGSEPEQPINVNFKVASEDRLLSLQDADLLDTLELIFAEGSRLQILSWNNESTGEKGQPEHEAVIFTMDHRLEKAENFRSGIYAHILLLKVVKLISEVGFDPDELSLPDLPFDKAVETLQQILAVHDAAGIGEKAQLRVVTTRLGYEQLQRAAIPFLRIGNEIGFGPVTVVCHRQITDFRIVRGVEAPEGDSVDVIIEGQWGEGQLRFLTPEQYQNESGEEAEDSV